MKNAILSTPSRFSFRRWFSTAVTDWSIPRARDDLVSAKPTSGPNRSPSRPPPTFVRQGEWIFVPAPEIDAPLVVHWCAPLAQPGGGIPPVVAELARGHPADPIGLFARGAVRHPDHATIHLAGWHRVYLHHGQRGTGLA